MNARRKALVSEMLTGSRRYSCCNGSGILSSNFLGPSTVYNYKPLGVLRITYIISPHSPCFFIINSISNMIARVVLDTPMEKRHVARMCSEDFGAPDDRP